MSVQSVCERPVAKPAVMARHLLIGARERSLRQAGPVEVDGLDGWVQVFDIPEGSARVQVKTITAVSGPCVFDWLLASRGSVDRVEPEFDAWWQSARLPRPAEEP